MSIAIIGAMDEEVAILCSHLSQMEKITVAKHELYKGILEGKEVIVTRSGIGKVCAGAMTAILIHSFGVNTVINTGVAGAVNKDLNIGDVVFSDKVAHHDVDVTAFNYEKGQLPGYDRYFIADNNLVEKAKLAAKSLPDLNIQVGTILSGDQFIADREKTQGFAKDFDNVMVCEMEGAAIAQVCSDFNVPFLVIRAASDKADGSASISFDEFLKIAAKQSAKLVTALLPLI